MAKTITMFGGLGLSASIAVKQRGGTAVDTQVASEITAGIYQASFTGLAAGTYLVNLVDSSGDINWADVVVVGSTDTDYYSKELDNIAESTYAYFVADANADAFKADISGLEGALINLGDSINNLSSQHSVIEGGVADIQTRLPVILESGRMAAALDSATIAAVADQVWDEAYADHNTAGSFGKLLNTIRKSNLAIDGVVSNAITPTVLTFASDVSATTSAYAHSVLLFLTGPLAGQNSPIISYTNTNGVFLLEEPLTSAPSDGDEFIVIANSHVHSVASISDSILTRNVSNVEATAGEHTLATAVLSMLEWEISGSNLIIKRTDGTTVHYTKVLSSATGTGAVITGLN
jgi:hypothetical protein